MAVLHDGGRKSWLNVCWEAATKERLNIYRIQLSCEHKSVRSCAHFKLIPFPCITTEKKHGKTGRKTEICNKFKFHSRASVFHPIQSSHPFAHLKIRNELNLIREMKMKILLKVLFCKPTSEWILGEFITNIFTYFVQRWISRTVKWT